MFFRQIAKKNIPYLSQKLSRFLLNYLLNIALKIAQKSTHFYPSSHATLIAAKVLRILCFPMLLRVTLKGFG